MLWEGDNTFPVEPRAKEETKRIALVACSYLLEAGPVFLGTFLCKGTSQNNPETTKQLTESQIIFKIMVIGHDVNSWAHFMCMS